MEHLFYRLLHVFHSMGASMHTDNHLLYLFLVKGLCKPLLNASSACVFMSACDFSGQ